MVGSMAFLKVGPKDVQLAHQMALQTAQQMAVSMVASKVVQTAHQMAVQTDHQMAVSTVASKVAQTAQRMAVVSSSVDTVYLQRLLLHPLDYPF
jgi:hypothetical protein